jgi:hypothetical protein
MGSRIGVTLRTAVLLAGAAVLLSPSPQAAAPRFHADDPLGREPETQDASRVQPWDIDLFWDLALNLFGSPGDPATNVKARNVSTIDEVPDSNWFTNRIGARPLSIEEAVRGPLVDGGPVAGRWSIAHAKEVGFAPGFTMRDGNGQLWFVSFDANGHPDAATGALLVANKIFWALGYWQVENHLIHVRPEELAIETGAEITPPSGRQRRMNRSDVDAVLRRAHRSPDGTYRAVAARALAGRVLGGFRYEGTRPDDPNDIVPHEHRRELRALKVFGAWTNLVDMKAGNTLDVLIAENGKNVVRHYFQDVGSTFGTGANAMRDYDEGWEHLFEGDLVWKRLVSLGFYVRPWQVVPYVENGAVGRFEGAYFDPPQWKPRVPTAAFRQARADDTFWAARRVLAFSDEMIRAIAETGHYQDASAARLLGEVLIQRRDRIAQAYLVAVNPVVSLALARDGTLTFENAAVAAGVASEPGAGYVVQWAAFDNTTGQTRPIGVPTTTTGHQSQAPAGLPASDGAFVKVQIAAVSPEHPSWAVPAEAFFRRTTNGWALVGFDRLPERSTDGQP